MLSLRTDLPEDRIQMISQSRLLQMQKCLNKCLSPNKFIKVEKIALRGLRKIDINFYLKMQCMGNKTHYNTCYIDNLYL
ncbi:hypothetical protein EAG_09653 [Camponotus floridanus]|uniref:Uncharacterized protein n=1 Tax=Camponotus floridanus TaxID=104421 RepID=E2AS95_CAMFO|nr:hypothetical protein EAG_09653 [Camponotus floridanus]